MSGSAVTAPLQPSVSFSSIMEGWTEGGGGGGKEQKQRQKGLFLSVLFSAHMTCRISYYNQKDPVFSGWNWPLEKEPLLDIEEQTHMTSRRRRRV